MKQKISKDGGLQPHLSAQSKTKPFLVVPNAPFFFCDARCPIKKNQNFPLELRIHI